MTFIYILKLQSNKYYVGKTKNPSLLKGFVVPPGLEPGTK